MPSPFPGMDPYLENPVWFPNLHHDLIFCIKQMLQVRLPESYYAQIMSRSIGSTARTTTSSIGSSSRKDCRRS